MKTVLPTICALCVSLSAHAASLRIHHRILDPATSPPPFSLRADFQVSSDLEHSLLAPQNGIDLVLNSDPPENILYQVALEREGDLSENDWDLSSVKACHLSQAKADVMNVHLSSPHNVPYAIDFFLHPTPHDGSCPKKSSASKEITFNNTTLNFKLARSPPSPELRVPPPLSPDGEPIQPEPEKTFLQKYWMYLAMGLLALMISGGAAPEEEQANAQVGGARASGR